MISVPLYVISGRGFFAGVASSPAAAAPRLFNPSAFASGSDTRNTISSIEPSRGLMT